MTEDDEVIIKIEMMLWEKLLDNASTLISYTDIWGSMSAEAYSRLLDILVVSDERIRVLNDLLEGRS